MHATIEGTSQIYKVFHASVNTSSRSRAWVKNSGIKWEKTIFFHFYTGEGMVPAMWEQWWLCREQSHKMPSILALYLQVWACSMEAAEAVLRYHTWALNINQQESHFGSNEHQIQKIERHLWAPSHLVTQAEMMKQLNKNSTIWQA